MLTAKTIEICTNILNDIKGETMNHRDQIINAQIDQARADDRVRDAAPELLAACKEALKICEPKGFGEAIGLLHQLRVAIAKASEV